MPKPKRRCHSPRPGISPLSCPRCHQHLGFCDRRPNREYVVRCAGCLFEGPGAESMQDSVLKWNQIRR